MDQSIKSIDYCHTPDMGEISGFGGGYETTCQSMLAAGVAYISQHKVTPDQLKILTNPDVFGLAIPDSKHAKELEAAIAAAPGAEDCTGAMMHTVLMRCRYVAAHGWNQYCQELRNYEKEEKTKLDHGL